MPLFTYKATRADGSSYEGELEAPDRFTLYREVRKEGGTVVKVEEAGSKRHFSLGNFSILGRVKEGEKIVLTRNLSAMISAGLALSRALSVVERQTKKKTLKNVLGGLGES